LRSLNNHGDTCPRSFHGVRGRAFHAVSFLVQRRIIMRRTYFAQIDIGQTFRLGNNFFKKINATEAISQWSEQTLTFRNIDIVEWY
jgi:hypothetical protein